MAAFAAKTREHAVWEDHARAAGVARDELMSSREESSSLLVLSIKK